VANARVLALAAARRAQPDSRYRIDAARDERPLVRGDDGISEDRGDPDRDLRFVFLGDHLTALKVVAILIATIGVIITALRPGGEKNFADLKPTLTGLVAAAAFALSASAFAARSSRLPASRS